MSCIRCVCSRDCVLQRRFICGCVRTEFRLALTKISRAKVAARCRTPIELAVPGTQQEAAADQFSYQTDTKCRRSSQATNFTVGGYSSSLATMLNRTHPSVLVRRSDRSLSPNDNSPRCDLLLLWCGSASSGVVQVYACGT